MVSRVVGSVAKNSFWFGGPGRIAGTTRINAEPVGLPVSRRVRLHSQQDGRVLGLMWSGPDGAYSFDRLRMDLKYYVVTFDHTGAYGGVIETDITPEAMP